MEHLSKKLGILYESPSNKGLWLIFILSFFGTIIISQIMAPIETYLKDISIYGVLEFEFMWNTETAEKIMNAWGEEGREKELFVSYVDYAYMVTYSVLFASITLIELRALDQKKKISADQKQKYVYLVLIPFIAAGFDAIENLNLIIILLNPTEIQPVNAFLASFCATIKFSLLFFSLFGIIFLLFKLIVKKKT